MSDNIAIKVDALSKCYQIYDNPRDRLKQFVLPKLQGLFGSSPKKHYQEFWALKDVSFEVKKGETVGIIGRNGSGKSTLLQMICGTLCPTSGKITTYGRIAALLELGSGFNPEFTGRENVFMNASLLGLTEAEIEARFDEIAAFAEIGDFITQATKTYSSGMMLRLAFAVQTVVAPNILIVDEALAVGDERFQRKCFARLEELKNGGASILFVSHSASQIVEFCDRVVLLDQGECLLQAEPMEAVRLYQRIMYASAEQRVILLDSLKAGETSVACSPPHGDVIRSVIAEDVSSNEFDDSLIPTSTQLYPENGARIDNFEIRDSDGKVVNVLMGGMCYSILMRGEFLSMLDQVHFGIHIRSISGAVISGQRFPEEGVTIELVEAGKKFEIFFHFNLSLIPGSYFIGGGIWTGGSDCAHRVLDGIMFRILPKSKKFAFGYCDLSSKDAIILIK